MRNKVKLGIVLLFFLGCREREGPGEILGWSPLIINEKNDPWSGDIRDVYVRETAGTIEFCIITHEVWESKEDVDFGIFLDVDRNPKTGLNSSQPNWRYTVNDIGADYVISLGFESASDSLLKWKKDHWDDSKKLSILLMEDNTDSLVCGILLEEIGSPSAIDILIIEASKDGNFDYVPDKGHMTFEIK